MTPQPPTNSNLPHRFRESSFRKYEALILAAVQAHPQQYRIRCSLYSLSPVTMSCRMRDAMRSLRDNKWTVDWPSGTLEKFLRIHAELVIREDVAEESITVTNASTVKAGAVYKPLVAPAMTTHPTQTEPISLTTHEQKSLICLLAHQRLLTQPVLVTGLTPIDITNFEQLYDISVDPQENGVCKLI